ncbi:CLUMA_CG007215, isoform A [Clunio marinus]|uniref:CLUMA_CG007215, isoform A n=1 Tax=Clunio marinus TaxID=568069 RepID=A0A1J1I492_9DIPT|nr:CLUMA_CG007215, isoform A [Clunio marinus]
MLELRIHLDGRYVDSQVQQTAEIILLPLKQYSVSVRLALLSLASVMYDEIERSEKFSKAAQHRI